MKKIFAWKKSSRILNQRVVNFSGTVMSWRSYDVHLKGINLFCKSSSLCLGLCKNVIAEILMVLTKVLIIYSLLHSYVVLNRIDQIMIVLCDTFMRTLKEKW